MAKTKSKPNAIDVHVGCRLRQLRNYRGFTQEQLAGAVGVTFQQVQKYELGINRMGASRLYEIAKVLDTPIQSFFPGFSDGITETDPDKPDTTKGVLDFQNKEEIEIIRCIRLLPSDVAQALAKLLKNAAKRKFKANDEVPDDT